MTTYKPPKTPKRFKTKAEAARFRDWIKHQSCIVCGKPGPCQDAHQSILGNAGMGAKARDDERLPECPDCHMIGEHGINGGIVTLWKTKQPQMWVKTPEEANPLMGKLYDKHDLREFIKEQCELYVLLFHAWEMES